MVDPILDGDKQNSKTRPGSAKKPDLLHQATEILNLAETTLRKGQEELINAREVVRSLASAVRQLNNAINEMKNATCAIRRYNALAPEQLELTDRQRRRCPVKAAIELTVSRGRDPLFDVFNKLLNDSLSEFSRETISDLCPGHGADKVIGILQSAGALRNIRTNTYVITNLGKNIAEQFLQVIDRPDLKDLQHAVEICRNPRSTLPIVVTILGKAHQTGTTQLSYEAIVSQDSTGKLSKKSLYNCMSSFCHSGLVSKPESSILALTARGQRFYQALNTLAALISCSNQTNSSAHEDYVEQSQTN